MKIVVAIDSFKGSLSSMEAGTTIKEAIKNVCDAEVIVKPLADGGEGTVDALVTGMGGNKISIDVTGPLGDKTKATYGISLDSKTAIIEMAEAAGIKLVPEHLLNPMNTTTYGVGEIILDAIQRGCRDFIIGIGGSSTNDGGLGMLQALGYEFYDDHGNPVGISGKELSKIRSITSDNVIKELSECNFKIACDVNNPLFGPMGAASIFGPQKGATPDIISILDEGLINFSNVVKQDLGKDTAKVPGAGAAGGLGYAFVTFLNGTLESGIEIILKELNLEDELKDADYVITGEGKLDLQTAMGKAPIGVAKLAKKHNKKVIAFAGGVTKDAIKCNEEGIDAYFPILQLPVTVNEAMEYERAKSNLKSTVTQVFRLIKVHNTDTP